MPTTLLSHPAVDAVLATAAELLGMEVVFIGTFDAEGFACARVLGGGLGVADGARLDRADSFCARMLAGAPASIRAQKESARSSRSPSATPRPLPSTRAKAKPSASKVPMKTTSMPSSSAAVAKTASTAGWLSSVVGMASCAGLQVARDLGERGVG